MFFDKKFYQIADVSWAVLPDFFIQLPFGTEIAAEFAPAGTKQWYRL